MKFIPTSQEWARLSFVDLPNGPSDLDSPDLAVLGSNWSDIHLRLFGLSILMTCHLSVSYLLHLFLPTNTKVSLKPLCYIKDLTFLTVFRHLVPEFLGVTEDDLKEFSFEAIKFTRNIFLSTFQAISEAMTTHPTHVLGTIEYTRDPSPESDLSVSSDEDKNERSSRVIVTELMKAIQVSGLSFIPPQSQEYSLSA
jgi:hypothetical protein